MSPTTVTLREPAVLGEGPSEFGRRFIPALCLLASAAGLVVTFDEREFVGFAFFMLAGVLSGLGTIHGLPDRVSYIVGGAWLSLEWRGGGQGVSPAWKVSKNLALDEIVAISETSGEPVRPLNWWHREHWWRRGPFRRKPVQRVGLLVHFERRAGSRSNFARSSPVAIYVSREFRDALLNNWEITRTQAVEG